MYRVAYFWEQIFINIRNSWQKWRKYKPNQSTVHDERKILKYMLKRTFIKSPKDRTYRIRCSCGERSHPIFYDKNGLLMVKTRSSRIAVLDKLIADGYLYPPITSQDHYGCVFIEYVFTDRGWFYFENRRREFTKTLITVVLLPLLVSLLTIVLMNLL